MKDSVEDGAGIYISRLEIPFSLFRLGVPVVLADDKIVLLCRR